MSAPRSRHRARAQGGFTLLELMVALTIGGLAISAMYQIGSVLIRQYHQQHQAANAMTSLRVALDQIKRDVARAGFLSTPNLVPGAPHGSLGCGSAAPGTGLLAAISTFADDVCATGTQCPNLNPGVTTANAGNGFTADGVVLFGNYETANEYPNVQFVNATTVSIGRSAHSYQTDFSQWYSGNIATADNDALMRAFAPGRLIRIRTTGGLHHFGIIQNGGVTGQSGTTDAQINFAPAIPAGCHAGTDGASVAPVSAIRYFPRNEFPVPNPNPPPWGPMAQLVREEVDPGDKATPLVFTEPTNNAYQYRNTRVILDYLVSFNLGFVMKGQDPAVGAPDPLYVPGNDIVGAAAVAPVNTNPERIRAVTIELSARSPEQDSTIPFANCGNLRCYQVFTDRPGSARVRTLRAEVFVPNIAYESY